MVVVILSKNGNNNPFADLPQALVKEMLENCKLIENKLSKSFKEIFDRKGELRKILKESHSFT